MSPGYCFYNTLALLAGLPVLALAAARGRLRGQWRERLGLPSRLRTVGGRRVWVHAVSVGEVRAAEALIAALRRKAPEGLTVWLSTTTATGREEARRVLPADMPVFTFPLDIIGSPGRALARLRPDLVILMETELWPNFLRAASKRGVKTMLANGRISERSWPRYRRFRFLFRAVLDYLDLLAMIGVGDRERVLGLGADPAKVRLVGNVKYDHLLGREDRPRAARLREELGLGPERRILAAGSTRSGEELLIVEAFEGLLREFPELHLIIAPRHIDRAGEVEALVRARGLSVVRRSRRRGGSAPLVTVIDVMGELFYLYGLADVAFCGASLVPLGGQNPFEPAVWAKPMLYGASMEDFEDARAVLERVGAGQTVRNVYELYRKARELLSDPEEARVRGQAGRRALEAHEGAADRLAELALGLVYGQKQGDLILK